MKSLPIDQINLEAYKPWFIHKDNTAYTILPKNGSKSIQSKVRITKKYTSEEISNLTDKRIFLIRNPLDRLFSLYKWHSVKPKHKLGRHIQSYKDLVDTVLDDHSFNDHWYPQTSLVETDVCTDIIRFGGGPLKEFFGVDVAHNASSVLHNIDTSYRIEEVKNYYSKDIEVFTNAI